MKIVQIAAVTSIDGVSGVYALTDDGKVFFKSDGNSENKWVEETPLVEEFIIEDGSANV